MPTLTNARVCGPDGRPTGATTIRIDGAIISAVRAQAESRGIDLRGSFVTPGFVDAHVHMTMTGLLASGVDVRAAVAASDLTRAVRKHRRANKHRFVWGYGWDDATWAAPPTADAIEQASGDAYVYLSRVDGHSALVSWRLFHAAGCERLDGTERDGVGRATGVVRRDAHHAVRDLFLRRIPASQLRRAHRVAAERAAAAGITTIHEMSGPLHAAGERDLDLLLASNLPVDVVAYYASDDVDIPKRRGLRTIGGDYNVDGSIGSRTAALRMPYADQRGHKGFLYRDAGDMAEFFESATRAGLQAGAHCIGDAACEAAVAGLERAARKAGARAVRGLRHRLEHFEMSDPDLIARAAKVGAALSVQPAFDAAWGGKEGMYAKRLGARRANAMNDFATMLRSGAHVAFGSDSPVTRMDALAGVRAAIDPTVKRHRVDASRAFASATEGGAWLAHRESTSGRIEPGFRADLVVWDGDPLEDFSPRILATISRGRVVYGALAVDRS